MHLNLLVAMVINGLGNRKDLGHNLLFYFNFVLFDEYISGN
jgi:hypothetical protein